MLLYTLAEIVKFIIINNIVETFLSTYIFHLLYAIASFKENFLKMCIYLDYFPPLIVFLINKKVNAQAKIVFFKLSEFYITNNYRNIRKYQQKYNYSIFHLTTL